MLKCIIVITPLLLLCNLGLIYLNHQEIQEVNKAFLRLENELYTPIYYPIGLENKENKIKEQICEYCIEEDKKVFLIYKKQKISYKRLEEIANEILREIPSIKQTPEIISLLVETVIVESDGGVYFNTKNLGGLGVSQVNLKSAKYLIKELEKINSTDLKIVNKYKVSHLSLKDNLIHNVKFNMAICCLYYYHMKGEKLYSSTKDLQKRAKLWKKVYNTKEGVGTPEIYIKRVKEYEK